MMGVMRMLCGVAIVYPLLVAVALERMSASGVSQEQL
jgi:hypothetical protein